jgi:hypothetical protein
MSLKTLMIQAGGSCAARFSSNKDSVVLSEARLLQGSLEVSLSVPHMNLTKLAIAAIALVAAAVPQAAFALEWVEVAQSERSTLYVDTDSISKREHIAYYWAYIVLHEVNSDGVKAFKHYESLDCSTGNYRVRRSVAYSDAGQVLESWDQPSPELLPTIPGSMQEALYEGICK